MTTDIFTYTDYRAFLRDCYAELKATKKAFSFRFFAKQAGFASPNFLKLVIDNQRNLTADSIDRFAKALKLGRQESEFFSALVQFNQATDPDDKNRFFEQMNRSRRFRATKRLEKEELNFYSHWYYSAIRELVNLPNFIEDDHWIGNRLIPKVPAKQVQQGLKLLLQLGLLVRDSRGRLRQADPTVSSGTEIKSLALVNFHREMLKQASESLINVPGSERDISSVTLGIRADQITELKEKISQFRQELLKTIGSQSGAIDRVYQLNIQLFPLSKGDKESL